MDVVTDSVGGNYWKLGSHLANLKNTIAKNEFLWRALTFKRGLGAAGPPILPLPMYGYRLTCTLQCHTSAV